jgi:hypothetical protein
VNLLCRYYSILFFKIYSNVLNKFVRTSSSTWSTTSDARTLSIGAESFSAPEFSATIPPIAKVQQIANAATLAKARPFTADSFVKKASSMLLSILIFSLAGFVARCDVAVAAGLAAVRCAGCCPALRADIAAAFAFFFLAFAASFAFIFFICSTFL